MELETGTALAVDGATLFYQTIGQGPPLVLIPGAHGTAVPYENFALALSSHFRVTSFDRRGFLRSTISPEATDKHPNRKTHADDAAALISHVSPTEPVFVFTCSGGAMVAVELLFARPHLVRKVILHEPFIVSLMRPALRENLRKKGLKILGVYDKKGNKPAGKILFPVNHGPSELKRLERSPTFARMAALPNDTMNAFFESDLPDIISWELDVQRLGLSRDKLVLFVGADMEAEPSFSPAKRLAELLHVPLTTVSGGHVAFATYVEETASQVRRAFSECESKL